MLGELARARQVAHLVLAVDPHARQPERGARLHVVEERRRHVDVARAVGLGLPEERLPVSERRLVRADVGRHDAQIDRHADRGERRVQEVGVGVRQDAELPAARPELRQGRRHVRERRPRRAATPRARPRVPAGRRAPRPPPAARATRPSPCGTGCRGRPARSGSIRWYRRQERLRRRRRATGAASVPRIPPIQSMRVP